MQAEGARRARSGAQVRDAARAEDVLDLLAHDRRTAHLDLDVRVDGGVAHVRGSVAREDERALVRTLLRRVAGLHGVWDLLRVRDGELTVVDIGSGRNKQAPEALGVDIVPGPGVDVVADLEREFPFAENSLDHVFAVHVLEHIHDLLGLMARIHRALRPTGVLHVLSPHWRFVNAVADPTHVRFFDVQTFKYFAGRRPAVPPWHPLMASATVDNVHADLQPLKDGSDGADPAAVARWFD